MKKIAPGFEPSYFAALVRSMDPQQLPLQAGETVEQLIAKLTPVLFDPAIDAKRVNLDSNADLIASSANNYYGPDVTQAEVERLYAQRIDKNDPSARSRWCLSDNRSDAVLCSDGCGAR